MVEELSTVDERQDEVKLLLGLEGELEGDDERVVHLREHRPFGQRVRDFRPRDDVGFADRLEGVDPHRVALADLHDLGAEERSGLSWQPSSRAAE